MIIKIEKKLTDDGSLIRTDELHLEIPQKLVDELDWEDGTLVEWERTNLETVNGEVCGKIILRNIEGLDIDGH